MNFKIRKLKRYRYAAEGKPNLMALIKAKELFQVIEVRNNHNYLLECKGIRHWFIPSEIVEVRDITKPVRGEYMPIHGFPPYLITNKGRMAKLVPDFIEVNTNIGGKDRVIVTMYTKKGHKFTKTVAELVLDTFTDQKRNKRVIRYKDGDLTNLNVNNLEYITRGKKLK
jgi:hypothetical protein